jgi:sulfite reductase alpha subunit-like flavoprotein
MVRATFPTTPSSCTKSLQTQRPDLASVSYGVIALGDRTYNETFCNGGRRFDQDPRRVGAKRIGDILLHDASAGTMPEEVAAEWIDGWVALCKEQLGRGGLIVESGSDSPQRFPILCADGNIRGERKCLHSVPRIIASVRR